MKFKDVINISKLLRKFRHNNQYMYYVFLKHKNYNLYDKKTIYCGL